MVIPEIERYQNLRPDVALIGPDLENDYAVYDSDYINSLLKLEADENIIIVSDDQNAKNLVGYPNLRRKREFNLFDFDFYNINNFIFGL